MVWLRCPIVCRLRWLVEENLSEPIATCFIEFRVTFGPINKQSIWSIVQSDRTAEMDVRDQCQFDLLYERTQLIPCPITSWSITTQMTRPIYFIRFAPVRTKFGFVPIQLWSNILRYDSGLLEFMRIFSISTYRKNLVSTTSLSIINPTKGDVIVFAGH